MSSTKKTIALVTYEGLPELDPDDQLLQRSLEDRGVNTEAAVWNDKKVDWSKFAYCILRSTWDYHKHYASFIEWAEYVDSVSKLINSYFIVKWNSNKTYLTELERAGLPVVPTEWINEQNDSLPAILQRRNWNEAIIKPSIGLATAGVKRTNKVLADTDQQHVNQLLKNAEVMVQEYLPSVNDYGERALIYIDGIYTHTVRKTPFQILAAAGLAGESKAETREEELAVGAAIMKHLDRPPVYARVDLVRDNSNNPLILELELVEPSLFLAFSPECVERFSNAILMRLN